MIEIFLFQVLIISRRRSQSGVNVSPTFSQYLLVFPWDSRQALGSNVGNQQRVTRILDFSFSFVFTAFPIGVMSITANNTAFSFASHEISSWVFKELSLKEVRQFKEIL